MEVRYVRGQRLSGVMGRTNLSSHPHLSVSGSDRRTECGEDSERDLRPVWHVRPPWISSNTRRGLSSRFQEHSPAPGPWILLDNKSCQCYYLTPCSTSKSSMIRRRRRWPWSRCEIGRAHV